MMLNASRWVLLMVLVSLFRINAGWLEVVALNPAKLVVVLFSRINPLVVLRVWLS